MSHEEYMSYVNVWGCTGKGAKTPLVETASPPFVQQLSIHRPCRLGYDAVTWAYAQEHVQAKFIVAGDMREQCLYIGVVTFERLL